MRDRMLITTGYRYVIRILVLLYSRNRQTEITQTKVGCKLPIVNTASSLFDSMSVYTLLEHDRWSVSWKREGFHRSHMPGEENSLRKQIVLRCFDRDLTPISLCDNKALTFIATHKQSVRLFVARDFQYVVQGVSITSSSSTITGAKPVYSNECLSSIISTFVFLIFTLCLFVLLFLTISM